MTNSRKSVRWLFSILAWALAAGCFSRPLQPALSPDQLSRLSDTPPADWRVHLDCLPPDSDNQISCDRALRELAELLAPSKLFRTVQATSQDAMLTITVRPTERLPYYMTPGHNPGLLLLSIAIPFWWSEPLGYSLTARVVATGATADISTAREGTHLMWGLAPLFNLFPNRGLLEHPERERQKIESQLLPLLAGDGR
jgi:hypothetical protein